VAVPSSSVEDAMLYLTRLSCTRLVMYQAAMYHAGVRGETSGLNHRGLTRVVNVEAVP